MNVFAKTRRAFTTHVSKDLGSDLLSPGSIEAAMMRPNGEALPSRLKPRPEGSGNRPKVRERGGPREEPEVFSSGSTLVAPVLEQCLRLQWRHGFGANNVERGAPRYTHGVHKYLAGMNPVLARELLPVLGLGGADHKPVLDPFCGAGTVLVESAALGKSSIGVDVSPLACFVSQHHVWTPEDPGESWGRLTAHAEVVGSVTITEQALAGHAGRKAQGLKAWGWLARGLYRVTGGPGLIPVHNPVGPCSSEDAARLWFCLSAALAHHAKRDRNGSHPASCEAAIRIFLETVADYGTRSAQLKDSSMAAQACSIGPGDSVSSLTSAGAAAAEAAAVSSSLASVHLGDARKLLSTVAAPGSVAGVLTSPPYPCVYDYVSHARSHRALLTRYSGTKGIALSPSSGGLGSRMFLETAVPEGRNWPQEWDSRQELGAYAATVKALRAQVPGRDGAWFPALDESGSREDAAYSSSSAAAASRSRNSGSGVSSPLREEWHVGQQEWMSATGELLQPGGMTALVLGDGGGLCGLRSAREAALATGYFEEVASATIRRRTGHSDESREAGEAAAIEAGEGAALESSSSFNPSYTGQGGGVHSSESNGKVVLNVGEVQRRSGSGKSRSYPGNRRTEHILVLRRKGAVS